MTSLDTNLSPDLIKKLLDKVDSLTIVIMEQNNQISAQTETINKLTETIMLQQQEIALLKERLNKNSKNSFKPPSSDGFKKSNPKSLRKPSEKKQGAQEGHEGKGLSVTKTLDEIVQHIHSKCVGCTNAGKCVSCGVTNTRYEIDTKVTEHQTIAFKCQMEKDKILTVTFSSNITGTMQYGDNLEALVVLLNTVGMMCIKRTHNMLSAVFNILISTGTISSMVKSCADKLFSTVKRIRQTVISLPIVHFDETGTRIDKKTFWVHNTSNELFTYMSVEEKRGHQPNGKIQGWSLPIYPNFYVPFENNQVEGDVRMVKVKTKV